MNGTDSQSGQLKARTKKFAVRIVRFYDALPSRGSAQVLGTQVLRSGTAVAANYRAACRARSKAEFTAKIGVVSEEADETVFWLELIVESGVMSEKRLAALLQEARELSAIFTASHETAKKRKTIPQFGNSAVRQ